MSVEKKEFRNQWIDVVKGMTIIRIDVVKGMTIILVVAHHSIISNDMVPSYSAVLLKMNESFLLFRMPLFFFISGVLGYSALQRDFRVFLRTKVAPLLYMYSLWSTIKWLILVVLFHMVLGNQEEKFSQIFYIALIPLNTLWFIYALFIFFTLTWALKRFSFLLFGAALAAFISVRLYSNFNYEGLDFYHLAPDFYQRLSQLYIWFILGYLMSSFVKSLPDIIPRKVLPLLLLWPVILFFMQGVDLSIGQMLMVVLANLAFGIAIAMGLSKTRFATPLIFVGRNSLVIYVSHFAPVFILHKIDLFHTIGPIYFLIILTAGIICPLICYEIAKKMRISWLFEYPFSRTEERKKNRIES